MLPTTASVDLLPTTETGALELTPDHRDHPGHPGSGGLKARLRAFLFGDDTVHQVGRYAIERPLASGGMGTVFLARDTELDRPVAVKLVRHDRVSAHAQARLRREAMSLAKLAHPNVVSIFEVGQHEGLLFMAMEYVEGMSLRRWLEAEERPWQRVLGVFEQAAEGLAAAHRAGFVHRDFKPDNVLVGCDERVRIVDFGLVASEGEADTPSEISERLDPGSSPHSLALTQTGELIGTPAYMAPEQFLGRKPSPASDQFAFFVALYEALSGKRPFPGTSVEDRMHAVLEGRARRLDGPGIPSALRSMVARGMAREPEARFADMDAVLAELRQLRSPPTTRPVRLGAALLAGAAAVVGGLVLASSGSGEDPGAEPAALAIQAASEDPSDEDQAKAALAALLDANDEDQRLRLANDYLAEFAERGGIGRRLIAEATRGELLWRRSCATPREGLCIELVAAAIEPAPCETHDEPVRIARSREAEAALEHLELAAQLAAAEPELDDEAEALALGQAIGTALVLRADAELEAYLELRPPRGLDFAEADDHSQLSQDAFAAFHARKSEAAQELAQAYALAKQSGAPAWIVRAAARTGLIYTDYANNLTAMPMVPSIETDAQRDLYCAALVEQSEPLRAQAKQVVGYCQSKAEAAGLDAKTCTSEALYSASTQ